MPYRLAKGHFHLFYQSPHRHVGSRPDGDSMWFKPNNQDYLTSLGGRRVEYNGGGFAQLRFEGIDALELHYKGSHQKRPECEDSRNKLLRLVGFTTVTFAPSDNIDASVRTASPHPIEGYILSRNVDPYGRPVAFVFVGTTPEPDGDEKIWLDVQRLVKSLNAKLIKEGQAYPTYYTGFPTDLRNELTSLTNQARNNGLGIWGVDINATKVRIRNSSDLELLAMWPKLYRRLFGYYADGNTGVSKFYKWLHDEHPDKDDQLWIISRGELGNMHDIFKVTGNKIKMTVSPEDLIIVPR